MTTTQLILATLVLPGLWGWLIGMLGHRWWPLSERANITARGPARLTDYDI